MTENKQADITLRKKQERYLAPVYSLPLSDEREYDLRIFPIDKFSAGVNQHETAAEIERPLFIQSYLENRLQHSEQFYTHKENIKNPEWRDQLYNFIETYLANNPAILADLEITDLTNLNPQQAIELTLHLVARLSKYRYEWIKAAAPTSADQSSTLELLREAQVNGGNADWPGNGVCRNFAANTLAIFEALRSKNKSLKNTYPVLLEGHEHIPEEKRRTAFFANHKDTIPEDLRPHAWNGFISVQPDGLDMAIVDPTWARLKLENNRLTDADYGLDRLEGLVYNLYEHAITGENDILRSSLLSYYLHADRRLTRSRASMSDELYTAKRHYLAWRSLGLLSRTYRYQQNDPNHYSASPMEPVYQIIRSTYQTLLQNPLAVKNDLRMLNNVATWAQDTEFLQQIESARQKV